MGLSLVKRLTHPSSEYGPAVVLEGMCLRRAHHLISVSEFTKKAVLQRYPDISADRISVIHLGSVRRASNRESETSERLRATWGFADTDRILLCVGRVENRKGITILFDAFSRLERTSTTKLLLVGSGDTAPYRRLAESLRIADRVVFAGFVDEETLNAAYGIATALLHPSAIEGFGLAVADAVASGLPVVACRVGSIPEIVRDGIDGRLVPYGDASAFGEAIEEFLQPSGLPKQNTVSHMPLNFTWDKTAEQTLALYDRLLSDRGISP
jgi:glycosyltransferase involved in cell wall biosynthesis